MANNVTGFSRIVNAAGYSWKGLKAAWMHESAFRLEALVTLVAIIIACWLDVDVVARILLIGSVMLIMIIEMLNSAIEAVVDRISHEPHPLAGRAKDMASAAVFIAIILALFVWVTLLWSYLG